MAKLFLLSLSALAGSSVLLASLPAQAVTLTPVSDPTDWTDLGWAVEGRAGATGFRDYEYAIGPDGAQAGNTGQIYRDWTNGEDVPWSLTWNGSTAAFTLGSQTISYAPVDAASNVFDGFYLLTRSLTRDASVAPGTSMALSVSSVNGAGITPVSSVSTAPAAGQDLDQFFFRSDTPISSLAGLARLSWELGAPNPNANDARGAVTFKLRGFDAIGDNQTVPEPGAIAALAALGLWGLGDRWRRRAQ